MSRYTAPRRADFYQGSNPTFFVTRYKSDLGNHVPAVADIGTATDRGYDPAITAISTTVAGATGVCTCPTADWWSAQVGGMVFRVEIENNPAGTLTVDLEFYRAVLGDSGGIEDWELIEERTGVANGEPAIIVGETAGSMVFVRVAAITNPDNGAQLYISARLASGAEIASCGMDSEVGSNAVGVKGWYATGRNWLGLLVDSAGALVVSGASAAWAAIVALLTSMDSSLTSIAEADEADPLALLGQPGTWKSPSDFTATYATGTKLALTGLPTAPSDEQWLVVYEKLPSGVMVPWRATDYAMSFTSTGVGTGTLTVTGATFEGASSEFVVAYTDRIHGYDATLDANQVVVLNAVQRDWVDAQSPLSAAALTNAVDGVDSGWINVKGMTEIAAWITFVTATDNGAYVMSFQMLANPTDAGTDEYDVVRGDWRYPNGAIGGAIALDHDTYFTITSTVAGGAAETDRVCVRFDVRGMDRVKFEFGTTTSPAANYGTVSLTVTEIN